MINACGGECDDDLDVPVDEGESEDEVSDVEGEVGAVAVAVEGESEGEFKESVPPPPATPAEARNASAARTCPPPSQWRECLSQNAKFRIEPNAFTAAACFRGPSGAVTSKSNKQLATSAIVMDRIMELRA